MSVINFALLDSKLNIRINIARMIFIPLVASLCCALSASFTYIVLEGKMHSAACLPAIVIGGAVYLALLFVFGYIKKEELQRLPIVRKTKMDIEKKKEELKNKERHNIHDLVDIMVLLRGEGGCAWDREQTHESIRNNLIEETYEVVEAIDKSDMALMREELGDLLLQVVFHARIAEEEGYFNFDDVANDICAKLILRHPHVFGDIKADTAEKVLDNWDKIKMKSKDQKTSREVLESVSKSLPSLMRAQKLASKVRKRSIDELTLEERIGETLLNLSIICDRENIDAEKALYDACEKYIGSVAENEKEENINET